MSEFIRQIDLATMLFVNAFISCASALLFLCFWRATDYSTRPASLLLWSLSNILYTIGFTILLSKAFDLTFPRAPLIGNLTLDVGTVVALIATNLYLHRPFRDNWPVVIAIILAVVEAAYALSRPAPDFGVMLVLGCALRAVLTTATGVALWRHAELPQRPPARLAAMFHFAWAGVMAMRGMAVLVSAQGTLAFDVSSVLGLLTRLLLTWMIAICLLWMIARQLNEQLIRQATRDTLTGLSNRRVMWEAGTRRIEAVTHDGGTLTLILLDIDHFKRINDRWGHPAGDAVLTAVAARLTESVRSTDLVARVGGEEFMILLTPGTDDMAAEIAERIRGAIEAMTIRLCDGTELRCTASVGYSRIAGADASWEALIAQADAALYVAKGGGRNRVVDHRTVARRPLDHGAAFPGQLSPAA